MRKRNRLAMVAMDNRPGELGTIHPCKKEQHPPWLNLRPAGGSVRSFNETQTSESHRSSVLSDNDERSHQNVSIAFSRAILSPGAEDRTQSAKSKLCGATMVRNSSFLSLSFVSKQVHWEATARHKFLAGNIVPQCCMKGINGSSRKPTKTSGNRR
jgi:hypothetical protein